MLVSVSKYSSLSTLKLISITYTSSSSAFFYCLWFQNINTRLAMLVSVSRYSSLSTLELISITYTSSFSASFYRPLKLYINPIITILLNISSYSLLSSFFLTFINLTNIFSILETLPYYHTYYTILYNNRAHSLSDSSPLGYCVNINFIYRKSA